MAGTFRLSPTKQAPKQSRMTQAIELGLDTFGDITDGPDGKPLHAAQVIRNLVEEAVLADEVGVDFIGVGEHHRADFAVSSPEIVLAAIASRLLASLLPETARFDVAVVAGAVALLVATAAVAAAIPASRVLRLNPLAILRQE